MKVGVRLHRLALMNASVLIIWGTCKIGPGPERRKKPEHAFLFYFIFFSLFYEGGLSPQPENRFPQFCPSSYTLNTTHVGISCWTAQGVPSHVIRRSGLHSFLPPLSPSTHTLPPHACSPLQLNRYSSLPFCPGYCVAYVILLAVE